MPSEERCRHIEGRSALAEAALAATRVDELAEIACAIVGQTLDLDRTFVYLLSKPRRVAEGLSEWLNPARSAAGSRGIYPLATFSESVDRMFAGEQLESYADDRNPVFGRIAEMLHDRFGMGAVLWSPFSIAEGEIGLLGANRVGSTARWTEDERAFLAAACRTLEHASARFAQVERAREAEGTARIREQRYRALYDSTPAMFFTVDRQGRITSLNRFAAEAMELPSGADGALLDLVHPDDRDRVRRMLEACFASPGEVHRLEFRKISGSGRTLWVKEAGLVQPEAPDEAVLTGEDITEQRVAEAALHQAQKLESLGVLAGGIAHDFNNLLHAILGNLDLVLMQLRTDDLARVPLERSVRAATRAAELVRGLLTYAGKAPPTTRVVDLGRLITETREVLAVAIGTSAGSSIDLPGEPLWVEADPAQLQQVLVNLVANAAEAIAEAGRTPGRIEIRAVRAPHERVRLEVRDDGIGMDSATRARIFDPFFSTKFAGRGLGLAAVAGIVRSHGGAVTVESERGRGSSFVVELPGADPAEKSEHSEPVPLPDPGRKTVLVIDDDDMVATLIADLLSHNGYVPLVASGGAQGLALHATHPEIAAVILDLSMPDGGGVPVLRELRVRAADLPVILTSGLAESEAMDVAGAEQVSGFLPKPFTARRMLEELARALPKGG